VVFLGGRGSLRFVVGFLRVIICLRMMLIVSRRTGLVLKDFH